MYATKYGGRPGLPKVPPPYRVPAPAKTEPKSGKHANCRSHVQHPYTSSGWLCVNPSEGETVETRTASMQEFADYLLRVRTWHQLKESRRGPSYGKVADAVHDITEMLPGATKPHTLRNVHYDPAITSVLPVWDEAAETRLAIDLAEISSTPIADRARASAAILAMSRRPAKLRLVAPTPAPKRKTAPRAALRRHSGKLAPCPKCGQEFRTENGRAWHCANRH